MRIDKYLWFIRMYKTRSQATQACKKGHIRISNRIVKPFKEVYAKDILAIRKNQINYSLVVLDLPKSRLGAKLVDLYRKDTTPKEDFEKFEMLKFAKDHYRKKGSGRPTKKERRDIEQYNDEDY